MKAAIFDRPGTPLAIESVPDPVPVGRQVVLQVARCGICGSDLHMTDGHGYVVPSGTVLGHEFAGEVVALGPDVERLKIGDRVAAMPIIGCGQCRYCLNGTPAWCVNIGYTFGGYADFALVDENAAILLPRTVSSADGALAEPLAVALHGVAMAKIQPGDHVLIQGAGPIGLAALFWARRLGAGRVDVVEGAPVRADIALKSGADSVSPPPAAGAQDDVTETSIDGPDVVIECVGRPGLLNQAISKVGRGGKVVSLGYCFQPDTVVPALAGNKEVQLLFPQLYTRREFVFALEALDRGAVEPRNMITRTVEYGDFPGAFESLRSSPTDCKVMLAPSAAK